MLAYLETCLIGVRGLVTDAATGDPLLATVTIIGRDHEIRTDPDVGDYHRMALPGTYDLKFEAEGYDSVTVTGVTVGPGDAARVDVSLGPPAQVLYPNGGESLPAGAPVTVNWTGSPEAAFHVQYTDNAGASQSSSDDFERTALGPDYVTGGDRHWQTTTAAAHTGSRSARSGAITHYGETWMTRTVSGGELSFWYSVSSEINYDWFNFYVNGDRRLHLSGTVPWTQYVETLPPGTYELKWEYTKDVSQSHGSDCVWIDDLEITEDGTVWTDVIALTEVGATSVQWAPPAAGEDYMVRVRAVYGSDYGLWDESDGLFSVVPLTADGDFDQDGDVDLDDFGAFQECFGQAATASCGDAFEFVSDGTIDLDDFATLTGLFTGP